MVMNSLDRKWKIDKRLLMRVAKLLVRHPNGLRLPEIWQDFQAHRSPWSAFQLHDAIHVLIVGEVVRQKWDGDHLIYSLHERLMTHGNTERRNGIEQVEA